MSKLQLSRQSTYLLDWFRANCDRSIDKETGFLHRDKAAFAAFHKFGKYVVQFRYDWFLKVPFADRLFMARFLHRSIPK